MLQSISYGRLPKQAMRLRVPRPAIPPAPRNPRRSRAAQVPSGAPQDRNSAVCIKGPNALAKIFRAAAIGGGSSSARTKHIMIDPARRTVALRRALRSRLNIRFRNE